ncbi:hypothetical protein C3369_11310 [Escherichia sp. ESNIH1]|uniref:hypothetical protein n=1 Tax=Escherichia sp. ESNIH1 TaxID=1985876 RepID=UPI000CDD5C66|nr:hypothetical protein [Escherichia sp. ESNIH1]POU02043.1 hypothetical protein C3369_11310 [Escherichia sp. ESNIH1]
MRKSKYEKQIALARQTAERVDFRRQFREFLESKNLPRTEDNAYLFAFGLQLSADERENLVDVLMTEIIPNPCI